MLYTTLNSEPLNLQPLKWNEPWQTFYQVEFDLSPVAEVVGHYQAAAKHKQTDHQVQHRLTGQKTLLLFILCLLLSLSPCLPGSLFHSLLMLLSTTAPSLNTATNIYTSDQHDERCEFDAAIMDRGAMWPVASRSSLWGLDWVSRISTQRAWKENRTASHNTSVDNMDVMWNSWGILNLEGASAHAAGLWVFVRICTWLVASCGVG